MEYRRQIVDSPTPPENKNVLWYHNKNLYKFSQEWEALNEEKITHDALAKLIQEQNLTPGQYYRVIDYKCTTTIANTRSANHRFDILLLAISNNIISEEGYAVEHEGEEYFKDAELYKWKIKYTPFNDTSKYDWADPNGYGVIYYLEDQNNNKADFDFKNIQYTNIKVLNTEAITPQLFKQYMSFNSFSPFYTIDKNWYYTFSQERGAAIEDATIIDPKHFSDNYIQSWKTNGNSSHGASFIKESLPFVVFTNTTLVQNVKISALNFTCISEFMRKSTFNQARDVLIGKGGMDYCEFDILNNVILGTTKATSTYTQDGYLNRIHINTLYNSIILTTYDCIKDFRIKHRATEIKFFNTSYQNIYFDSYCTKIYNVYGDKEWNGYVLHNYFDNVANVTINCWSFMHNKFYGEFSGALIINAAEGTQNFNNPVRYNIFYPGCKGTVTCELANKYVCEYKPADSKVITL